MFEYKVWSVKNCTEYVVADNSFVARTIFAKKHREHITEVMAVRMVPAFQSIGIPCHGKRT